MGGSAGSGGEEWFAAVLVGDGGFVFEVVCEDGGGFWGEDYVAFAFGFAFEWGSGGGSVAEFEGWAGCVEVFLIESPEAAESHSGFPEEEDCEVSVGGVFVFVEVVEDGGCFLFGEEVVADFVVFGDSGDSDEFGGSSGDGLDGGGVFDEVFDGTHVVFRSNWFDTLEPPFFEAVDEFAVEIVHVVDLVLVAPVGELVEGGAVVVVCFVCYFAASVSEVAFGCVLWWGWFEFHSQ